ncbi:MAG: DPP IV N-terminal domain-containing protein, partial [Blastocatellia bacterium]
MRKSFIAWGGALLLALLPAAALAQQKNLTIDTIFGQESAVNFSGRRPRGLAWLKDGEHYLLSERGEDGKSVLLKFDAKSGESVPLFDASKMESAFSKVPGITADEAGRLAHRPAYQLSPAEDAVLINEANDIFYYAFGRDEVRRLTNDPEPEVGEQFSPDGRMVSFVRSNNIFVLDLATGQERALTTDGGAKTLNGRLDWVYQEEVYGRGHFEGYWWSPDSKRIAFLHLDESPVLPFQIIDHIPYEQNVEVTYYPRSGDPNPKAKLGMANVSGSGISWVNNYKYEPVDLLIARVTWTPDGSRLIYQAQNRQQTWLDMN